MEVLKTIIKSGSTEETAFSKHPQAQGKTKEIDKTDLLQVWKKQKLHNQKI